MDSWLIKQSKSVESDIDILGATSSIVDGSPAEKIRVRKYQTDFLTFGFTYQLVNGGSVLCVVKFSQTIFSMQEICVCTCNKT
jgi:hypothetical protein